ncbi:Hsp20/alpha crystallin family protein [Bdellovibrio sp. HCB2-146]|uniref:Hsp20/alpha crystallin family protein n=1 Tax=Bdellovibrio sp. HCB2-146 TaxID=3394362 RepID=UPI0039BC54BE
MPSRSLSPWGGRRRDLMNQFEEFMNDFDLLSPHSGLSDFSPAVDIEEKDNMYLVTADLPGMKKEEIKIDLSDNVLTISGERTRESKGEGRYTERTHGKFMRSFTLPSRVDPDKISAQFENGVLRITLNKSEASRGRSIKIQ